MNIYFITVFSALLIIARTRATFVNITGCPSLFLFNADVTKNVSIPTCFCDNATNDEDPPVQINCLIKGAFKDLTAALASVQRAGKRVSAITVEYMEFDDNVGIPDNYFKNFNVEPSEISISTCKNNRLPLNNSFAGLEKSLKKLTISQCNVLTVPASLSRLTSLESLTLQDTFIYIIKKHDFQGLRNLKYLDLHGNQMYYLEEGAFDSFRNVETAVLGPRNSLNSTSWPELNKFTSAKTLILYNNAMEDVPDDALNALANLETLDLSTNYIENITASSFAGLKNLKKLILNQNWLRNIEDGSFRSLANLRELILGANYIQGVWPETFEGLTALESLDLGWNDFYVLGEGTFNTMPRLKALNLQREKKLQYLDPFAFNGLRNLQTLKLSESNVTAITSEMLKPIGMKLQSLDLRGTSLFELNDDAFRYGANIQNLSIADTYLMALPNGIFNYLTQLKNLDLSDNKWLCDDQLVWLIEWLTKRTNDNTLTLINPEQTTCWEPLELRNTPLISVDPLTLKPYVPLREIDQPSITTTPRPTRDPRNHSSHEIAPNNHSSNEIAPNHSSNEIQPRNHSNEIVPPQTENSKESSKLIESQDSFLSSIFTSTTPTIINDPTAIKTSNDDEDSTRIKIIIAIVASVVSVATIAVILAVVLLMRKHKKKQRQQHSRASTPSDATSPNKTMQETEMTRINETIRNGSRTKNRGDRPKKSFVLSSPPIAPVANVYTTPNERRGSQTNERKSSLPNERKASVHTEKPTPQEHSHSIQTIKVDVDNDWRNVKC